MWLLGSQASPANAFKLGADVPEQGPEPMESDKARWMQSAASNCRDLYRQILRRGLDQILAFPGAEILMDPEWHGTSAPIELTEKLLNGSGMLFSSWAGFHDQPAPSPSLNYAVFQTPLRVWDSECEVRLFFDFATISSTPNLIFRIDGKSFIDNMERLLVSWDNITAMDSSIGSSANNRVRMMASITSGTAYRAVGLGQEWKPWSLIEWSPFQQQGYFPSTGMDHASSTAGPCSSLEGARMRNEWKVYDTHFRTTGLARAADRGYCWQQPEQPQIKHTEAHRAGRRPKSKEEKAQYARDKELQKAREKVQEKGKTERKRLLEQVKQREEQMRRPRLRVHLKPQPSQPAQKNAKGQEASGISTATNQGKYDEEMVIHDPIEASLEKLDIADDRQRQCHAAMLAVHGAGEGSAPHGTGIFTGGQAGPQHYDGNVPAPFTSAAEYERALVLAIERLRQESEHQWPNQPMPNHASHATEHKPAELEALRRQHHASTDPILDEEQAQLERALALSLRQQHASTNPVNNEEDSELKQALALSLQQQHASTAPVQDEEQAQLDHALTLSLQQHHASADPVEKESQLEQARALSMQHADSRSTAQADSEA